MLHQLRHSVLSQPLLLAAVFLVSITAILWPHPQPEPVVVPVQAEPPVVPPPPPPAKIAQDQDNATTVLELFNPSDQYLTNQMNETSLSQQVEQVMATSYILVHCNLMDNDEYRDTFRALIVFAQHTGLASDAASAEAKVRNLAESAGATYSLLYARKNCMDPQLPAIARQMLNWQNIYLRK